MRSLQQAAVGAVLWPPPPSPLPSPPLPSPPPPPYPPNLLYRVGTAALDKEVVLGSHGYEDGLALLSGALLALLVLLPVCFVYKRTRIALNCCLSYDEEDERHTLLAEAQARSDEVARKQAPA